MTTRIEIGDVTIERIIEQEAPMFDVHAFFPALGKQRLEENRAWLEPRYLDPATQRIVLCIQSYLIRTPHHNILIDTCVGNHKQRPGRAIWHDLRSDRWERSLAATGLSVADIDYVMCTHLHGDHVGWNTRLESGRWVPTFPKARYLIADRELEYWSERARKDPAMCPWMDDSVLPVVAANRADIVKSDFAMSDIVRLVPTPGHTIDHFSVAVGGETPDAFITGDMVHSPIQLKYPHLGMMSDYSSQLAGETRRRVFAAIADTGTLLCAAHFASPSIGRLTAAGDGYALVET